MRRYMKAEQAPYGSLPQDHQFSEIYDQVHAQALYR